MELTCIVCPRGCRISIDEESKEVIGATCARGEKFALTEITNPTRTVCTTVKTIFPSYPFLPIRTDGEIPKEKMKEAVELTKGFCLDRKVKRGEVVISNILDTNVNFIATADIE